MDFYDPAVLAREDEVAEESYEKRIRDRLAAEEALDAMDARRAQQRESRMDSTLERINQFEQQELDMQDDFEEEELDEQAGETERALNLEAFECPLREWIAEERTRREIHRRFKRFLLSYYVGIEEVTRWVRKHENLNPIPPLPPNLKVSPAIYPQRIR